MRDYSAANPRLFTPEYARQGVVNLDDPFGRELVELATIPLVTFSANGDPRADWRAGAGRLGADGRGFRVVGAGGIQADARARPGRPLNRAPPRRATRRRGSGAETPS